MFYLSHGYNLLYCYEVSCLQLVDACAIQRIINTSQTGNAHLGTTQASVTMVVCALFVLSRVQSTF